MAKRIEIEREEKAKREREALRLSVEQSRVNWLGKRVFFLGFLNDDNELREGRFTEVRDNGEVIFAGPMYPWSGSDEMTSIRAGGEEGLLSVLRGWVVGEDASLG